MRYKEDPIMPISLRIPRDKEKLIQKPAEKACMTQTAVILSAVDEKLGLTKTGTKPFGNLPAGSPTTKQRS